MSWRRRLAWTGAALASAVALAALWLPHADGPVFVFHGGPLRSGERVALDAIDWHAADAHSEFEMELVGEGTSLTLWFSVDGGVPYVACDLDCEGGRLARWPQHVALDDRVVVRIDGQRAEGRLVFLAHGTEEYARARRVRERKYSGEGGGRAAMETAAHGAVVGVGEALTGRDRREEPGDRLYRIDPR